MSSKGDKLKKGNGKKGVASNSTGPAGYLAEVTTEARPA